MKSSYFGNSNTRCDQTAATMKLCVFQLTLELPRFINRQSSISTGELWQRKGLKVTSNIFHLGSEPEKRNNRLNEQKTELSWSLGPAQSSLAPLISLIPLNHCADFSNSEGWWPIYSMEHLWKWIPNDERKITFFEWNFPIPVLLLIQQKCNFSVAQSASICRTYTWFYKYPFGRIVRHYLSYFASWLMIVESFQLKYTQF